MKVEVGNLRVIETFHSRLGFLDKRIQALTLMCTEFKMIKISSLMKLRVKCVLLSFQAYYLIKVAVIRLNKYVIFIFGEKNIVVISSYTNR